MALREPDHAVAFARRPFLTAKRPFLDCRLKKNQFKRGHFKPKPETQGGVRAIGVRFGEILSLR